MIVRIVRGRLAPEALSAARAALGTAGLLPDDPRPGLVRSYLATRDVNGPQELAAIEIWATPEAASAESAGGTSTAASLAPVLDGIEVAHFEVDELLLRASTHDPVAIRMTLGRFSKPGADLEMMEVLRERMPTVGPEMTESYVGRRMVGRAVEVLWVSAWSELPPDRPLDAPFWPAIALRYDEFVIAVYEPRR